MSHIHTRLERHPLLPRTHLTIHTTVGTLRGFMSRPGAALTDAFAMALSADETPVRENRGFYRSRVYRSLAGLLSAETAVIVLNRTPWTEVPFRVRKPNEMSEVYALHMEEHKRRLMLHNTEIWVEVGERRCSFIGFNVTQEGTIK